MEKSKKKLYLIIVGIIVIILIGFLVYHFYTKKDDEIRVDESYNNSQLDGDLLNKTFSSKDNKFTLKIVSKDDKDAYKDIINKFYSLNNEETSYNNDRVIYYGYLNNQIIKINKVNKYDNYYILETTGTSSNILLNINGNLIEEDESRFSLDDDYRFFGDGDQNNYLLRKVDDGYFIISYCPADYYDLYKVYTTNWRLLGYYGNYEKTDSDGIYVYDNEKLKGLPIKYNTNGIKVESDGNMGEELSNKTFSSKDNKYILKIVDKNNKEAINDAKKKYIVDEFNDVLYYGYLNDEIIEIDYIQEDYSSYHLGLTISVGDGVRGMDILIDKNEMVIEKVD